MNFRKFTFIFFIFIILIFTQFFLLSQKTSKKSRIAQKKIKEIQTPKGFQRVELDTNSFGFYLRNLNLSDDNKVYLFNGNLKNNQSAHYAVILMDVGKSDLQQCADAVIRLRAEYLYKKKMYNKIHFNFLSDGKPRYYKDYAAGDYSYSKFRKYLNWIFAYSNTKSLIKELKKIDILQMQVGDVFIQVGNPYGHAIIVVDMAYNPKNNEKIFLIAQSYMPAQSIHILKNINNPELSPWYKLVEQDKIITPEWNFTTDDLHRFQDN